ncbi:Putative Zn-dependent protease, contains TPR repeats [Desulfofustis glycolicus DSM 9705]|uniref:Putative Zn-dependent protease, contains TPR repeats n=2 Tax=Desulfofustis glycolicus TaxID=51195 RepID=A0A1M5YDM0_9BACT|nr:Putative Zn-dependent protease, contains TPR repeats [Desulfofustis glycolicus DSM 9705]
MGRMAIIAGIRLFPVHLTGFLNIVIYANLLVFLTAIFLFSVASVPETPAVSAFEFLLIFVGSVGFYGTVARRTFRSAGTRSSSGYFRAEKRLSILALVVFAVLLYFGEVKYYLSFLSFGDRFPALLNVGGLALFLLFLSLLWLAGRRSYGQVFGKSYGRGAFIAANVKANLPIVLPWVALSLVYDLVALVPSTRVRQLIESPWGDVLFFALFLVLVVIFFPPLVRRLWGCTKMPDGPLLRHLQTFCRRQDFHADIYIWPLFEGRVLTAAVMGIVPGLRYILLTPAIIETMSEPELEAVMAHEIGHVKKKHLLLYVLLIGGFSAMAGFLAEPMLFYLLSHDAVYHLMSMDIVRPETIIGVIGGAPFLLLLLFYFRFVFGYFIRNFERQADLYVFQVLGNGQALVAAFEKIVWASGQPRDQPNWHHFGIGERIAHLELCEREPRWIARQDRKVSRSLIAYILVLAAVVGLASQVPTEQLARNYEAKYIEMVLMRDMEGVEDQALWYRLLGDLLFNRKLEKKALVAYNKALELEPDDPELLNNLAWLLLTGSDPALRDPVRALQLAEQAARLQPRPHILDTLATAYWANGMMDQAIAVERQALLGDPQQAEFYRRQLERFQSERYHNSKSIADE